MRYFSMFTGIGGFELGIEQASNNIKETQSKRNKESWPDSSNSDRKLSTQGRGKPTISCVGYSEIDKYAIQTYERHFPEHKNYGSATDIDPKDLPDFDMLCGGFPCQTFSIAGKRKGFGDARGTLFFDIARIAKHKKPRLLFLENVKGLLSADNGWCFAEILRTLDELGYDVEWQVCNSKNFGVPQNRERVFIIGHLRGTGGRKIFPIQEANIRNIRADKQNTQKRRDKPDNINTIRRTSYSYNMRIRRLTPTECERLQGFPDGWTDGVSDTQRYKQLGNAVTVNVIQAIAERLFSATQEGGAGEPRR